MPIDHRFSTLDHWIFCADVLAGGDILSIHARTHIADTSMKTPCDDFHITCLASNAMFYRILTYLDG